MKELWEVNHATVMSYINIISIFKSSVILFINCWYHWPFYSFHRLKPESLTFNKRPHFSWKFPHSLRKLFLKPISRQEPIDWSLIQTKLNTSWVWNLIVMTTSSSHSRFLTFIISFCIWINLMQKHKFSPEVYSHVYSSSRIYEIRRKSHDSVS